MTTFRKIDSAELTAAYSSLIAATGDAEEARRALWDVLARHSAKSYSLEAVPGARDRALSKARGCYQAAIVDGTEALSGATLRGKAKSYGGRYARSAASIAARTDSWEYTDAHRARILVLF